MHARPAIAVLAVVLSLPALACSGGATREPTIPTIDFTPVAVIVASPQGLDCVLQTVTTSCEVPAGSVIEIRNLGPGERRLQAGETFDTGIMLPGETTTVVLGAEPTTLEVRDLLDPTARLELTVLPRDTNSGSL